VVDEMQWEEGDCCAIGPRKCSGMRDAVQCSAVQSRGMPVCTVHCKGTAHNDVHIQYIRTLTIDRYLDIHIFRACVHVPINGGSVGT
jgi:hypothetical protein